ncbi:efflux RND transporter permease subunit [Leeia oryzae]|uniref:efflux RND transporter permease subunit n=1 Tax=Leeia oryzae TaxID=356662 RepID=UPI0003623931|nr:efflux RND transporter permease subunit [Leeia oryzae]
MSEQHPVTDKQAGGSPLLGVSGRIVAYFQKNTMTPLLALIAALLGLFAILVTPREEEPQINVTMANVVVPYAGASVTDVEQHVAIPYEQMLDQIAGVDHVYSVSRPGMAIMTVQFKVGVPHETALVRLYDTVHSHLDSLPTGLGVGQPIVKPKGIDDVPVMALTLWSKDAAAGGYDLERAAHSLEVELKRVAGTREVQTIGGPGQAVNVWLDARKLSASGISVVQIQQALQARNVTMPSGALTADNQRIEVETGGFLASLQDVGDVIVGVFDGRPVYLKDVARLEEGPPVPERYVWHGTVGKAAAEHPAVTLQITKKPGENAVDVTSRLQARIDQLKGTVIPDNVMVTVSRDYGVTANDKAKKLIQKLLFATASVVALVWLALGRREAGIVGLAVILTLLATLFASWAWGFTLNRVSLFALIFSIGILVDDAIVVVENIHRHRVLDPHAPLLEIIPAAVDEVGGPTILATLTVIAALLPMAFVSGLMGPYMSPIPINASMGMLISLAIAFVVTPWLANRWLGKHAVHPDHADGQPGKLERFFQRVFAPFVDPVRGGRMRMRLWAGIMLLILASVSLAVVKLVVLKMLPFDNKSEFQVVVDMPVGTPVEKTAAVLHEMGSYLATVPEVIHYQAYAGTSAPINFNGLVRQYDLRAAPEYGDLQVNLLDKHERNRKSHEIAQAVRPGLEAIARRMGANVNLVEVPPGPPVRAPIVAEVYGPDQAGRDAVAAKVKQLFSHTKDIVAVDSSLIAKAPKLALEIRHDRAAAAGVSESAILATMRTALGGLDASWLHDKLSKYPEAIRLSLPASQQSRIENALQLRVPGGQGQLIPLSELVTPVWKRVEQPRYHKDLLPVTFVTADMAGSLDSPLYGMFSMRHGLFGQPVADGIQLGEYFIRQPQDPYRQYALKWDGEWQITYETFRDMGAAYAVGLILIYLLVVAQFRSYLLPLVIMAPIPLTIIGVMPGHALLGAQFTATSMIGMIALAGIIVRNSILLVDFIRLQVSQGVPLPVAVVQSAATRAKPIALTGLAAMLGAFFILDDPIFNGLAISLIFGILVSTVLTLVVIPLLYFVSQKHNYPETTLPQASNHKE